MNTFPMNLMEEGDGKRSAEILIYEEIGVDPYTGEGVGANQFARDLSSLGDLDELHLRISSPGGNVFEAHAMYNDLVRTKARVFVEIVGIAGSAASYVAMAGDEIAISENGLYMIHRAWGGCLGNCKDMRDHADALEKMDGTIAGMYASRTNRRSETWMRLMDDESWFNAEEAVKNRLADKIIPNKGPAAPPINMAILNRISKRPERIAALVKLDEPIEVPEALDAGDTLLVEPTEDIQAKLASYQARAAEVE